MRLKIAFLTAALFAVASPSLAQSSPAGASEADAARPTPAVERMRDAVSAGDIRGARRAALEAVRVDGDSPATVEALWMLAQLDNADGRLLRAASYVDRIAEVAAEYGDPVLQSRALLEVTALYAGAREHQAAADLRERLRPLLDSPHLSTEFRAEAQARLHL